MIDDQRSDGTPEPSAASDDTRSDDTQSHDTRPEPDPAPAVDPPAPPVPDPAPEPAAEPAPPPVAEEAADEEADDDAAAAEFAAMLDADGDQSAKPGPKAGDRVTGTLVQIGETDAFVDYGGRSELPISVADLQDADGELTVAVGDSITAYATGKGDDLRLAMKRKLTGKDPKPIKEALESGVPLSGTVKETNKGGFVVDIGGWRAFCPISQVDDRYVEDPAVWVGRKLEFRVIEFGEGGRRLVVSRRAILVEEKERLAVETRRNLTVGNVLEGRVVRLLPFGAFVDLGGVEGLVHVSELSHARVAHPSDVVEEGQTVKVEVLDIQNLGRGREERISLSMKTLSGDPWQGIEEKLPIGEWVEGVVVGTTHFGAFVELMPGVNGLVHVSAISSEPVNHPDDVLSVGQQVSVRIVSVDPAQRRVSLAITR